MFKLILILLASLMLTGCLQNSPSSSGGELSLAAMSVSEAPKGLSINGPEIAVIGENTSFSLSSPAPIASSTWNFGDGTAVVQAVDKVTHAPNNFGLLTISVTAKDVNGVSLTATKHLNVIGFYDGLQCVTETSVSLPAQAYVGTPMTVSSVIPSCFQSQVSGVIWSFGDGAKEVSGASASHTYASEGDYTILMHVQSPLADDGGTFITLERVIHVSAAAPSPTPTPNPLACSDAGSTRESMIGDIYSETRACGVGGERSDKFQMKLVEECQTQNGVLLWTEVSRTPVLQSQGECVKQSCKLPDGSLVKDGQSRTLYSSATPAGSCELVSSTRTCHNGVLDGNTAANQITCAAGCEGFGISGTSKLGVVIGTTEQPKQCAFGEEGYHDVVQQVVDQLCQNGSVSNSNMRNGQVVTAGACPTYAYVGSDTWSKCDADCGGKQSRLFECRDSKGALSPAERCTGAMPFEQRACDANPEAVARVDIASKEEEAGSVGTCPKNQLGVVIQTRTTTTKTAYACLDHKVQVSFVSTSSTPWVQESYCRDYTAHRCSQDSISNTEAQARYDWMVKCQDKAPVIKEFLEQFDNVKAAGNYTIDGQGRHVYPTFMNRATTPEKPWIAPKKASASCDVPATAYVAAVCLSSCATPEQEIIAQMREDGKLRRVPFLDAVNANLPAVATLRSEATLDSKNVKITKVEQWVSEMMDTEHEILNFKTASGGLLRITPNHPVVADDGSVRLASGFKVGDNLVKFGGVKDPIVAIDHETYFGKVYNVFVKSASPQHNVVITSGYLNGTAFFQNEGASNMNREILRKKLTHGALSK